MKTGRKSIGIVVILFIFLCIHISSPAWAETEPPTKVVKDFAKAYFMLDSSMAAYLSKDARMNKNKMDMVDFYLDIKAADAQHQGYKTNYLQQLPVVMKTRILDMDDSSAKIEFNAITLRSINPLFRIIGFVFGLIDENEVRDIINVVKEDGEWKIGPGAFDMPIPL